MLEYNSLTMQNIADFEIFEEKAQITQIRPDGLLENSNLTGNLIITQYTLANLKLKPLNRNLNNTP